MRQLKTIEHVLEVSVRGQCFGVPFQGIFNNAKLLASEGLLVRALTEAAEVAEEARINEFACRIVTHERTITVLASWESSGVTDGRG